jgi:hypothetical protein
MATQYYTFSLDSFTILNTRARHLDTDYVGISLAVAGQAPMAQTRAMGDLNNGTYNTGLAFENVAVDDDQAVIFSYFIVNNGHSDPNAVEKALMQAASTLASIAAQKAAAGIGAGLGAAIGLPSEPELFRLLAALWELWLDGRSAKSGHFFSQIVTVLLLPVFTRLRAHSCAPQPIMAV